MSFYPQVVNHNNMILKGPQDKDDKAISHSYLKKKKKSYWFRAHSWSCAV